MAVETAEDLAAMFSPEDFGVPMLAFRAVLSPSPGTLGVISENTVLAPQTEGLPFIGIQTTGYVAERPGTTADVSMMVPRIIATKASLPDLQQNDEIELPSGQRVIVNDVHYKGELIIIHYHENW